MGAVAVVETLVPVAAHLGRRAFIERLRGMVDTSDAAAAPHVAPINLFDHSSNECYLLPLAGHEELGALGVRRDLNRAVPC